MVKRLFALALSAVLACGLVPAAAFAQPEQSAGASDEAAGAIDGSTAEGEAASGDGSPSGGGLASDDGSTAEGNPDGAASADGSLAEGGAAAGVADGRETLAEGGSTDADEGDWAAADVRPGAFSAPSVAALSRYNYPDAAAGVRAASEDESDLPARFDLRETGDSTPVKYQNPWGSCWTFGTMASLESNVLVQGGLADGSTPDFSERQLAWFGRTAVGAETDADQAGEGAFAKRTEGATSTDTQLTFNAGGDYGISTAVLSAWFGAADEADIPYTDVDGIWDPYDTSGNWSLPESDRTVASVHVKDVISLPSPAVFSDPENPSTENYTYDPDATAAIKRALMDNGAVSVSYHADQSRPITDPDNPDRKESEYFNYTTWAQYVRAYITKDDPATPDVDERTTANHAVAIVGWDDTISPETFSSDPAKQPPAAGAWIVKNSWSDDWGLGGYFYLSYYDMSICEPTSFLVDLPDANGSFSYDSNYQYDYLSAASVGKIEPGLFGEAVAAANVFEAEGDETLEAVSATTANPGSTVQVEVYLLDGGATDPTDGTLAASQTETVEYGGYHTIALDEPVALSAGQRFSVVERIKGYEGAYLPLEVAAYDANDPDEAQGGYMKAQRAVANAGESFYSADGGATWSDVTTLSADEVQKRISPSRFGGYPQVNAEDGVGNVMIKAFTTDGTEPEPEPEPEEPDDPPLRSSFDPREEGLATPVRDQGATDLCGPFASMAALETSLVYDGAASDELVEAGLSPFHAVYFATMGDEEREAGGLNAFMPDNPYGGGISPFTIANSLAAGKGAVIAREGQTDAAYEPMDEALRFASDVRLTGTAALGLAGGGYWETLEGDALRAAAKRVIAEEGPVVAEFCSRQGPNFNGENSCYYTAPGQTGYAADHYVAVVGWDDEFPRENFNKAMRPESDGAWLVKNSWGTDQGEAGYFWISYEDATLDVQAALFGEAKRADEAVYQYDEAGWTDSLSVGGTAGWAANVFTSGRDEQLDRVQFCTTGVGTAYEVEVRRGVAANGSDPRGGELVAACAGVQEFPGWVTVALDEPVALSAGETFSVVVRLQNESYAYPLAVEAYTPDPELAGAEPEYMGRGEGGTREVSWVSSDGVTWEDPAGYGRDLARGAASGGEGAGAGLASAEADGVAGGADGRDAASVSDAAAALGEEARAAFDGGSSRSYVTNVCVKALTVPRDASGGAGDAGGVDGAMDDPKLLASTGDALGAALLAAGLTGLLAAVALTVAAGRRRFPLR